MSAEAAEQREEQDEWYPGKMLGLPKPEGQWYPGQMLGLKRNRSDREEYDLLSQSSPLDWENIDQLNNSMIRIDSVEGILEALKICVYIANDDAQLANSVCSALMRIGNGNTDKMVEFGNGGACDYVVKLLHFYNFSSIEKEVCHSDKKYLYDCLHTIVTTVECLSSGSRRNRHRLARSGACFYLVEVMKYHCLRGENTHLLGAILNAVWQLSFKDKLSKKSFRDCGTENYLWYISQCELYPQPIRHRASSVLKWLKSQLVEDISEIFDPRTLSGALLLSVSDISMTSVQGNSSDALKIAIGSFVALENVLLSGDTSSVMQDAIEYMFLPATLIIIARRILRFYKKIFHANNEGLYNFICKVCSTACCFLSKEYRTFRREARIEDNEDAEVFFNKISRILPSPAVKRTDSDDIQSYSYCENTDAIVLASPLEIQISKLENRLIENSRKQMRQAGACRLFVKALALFVPKEIAQKEKQAKQHSKSSDPMAFLNSAAGSFAKGIFSGFQEVRQRFDQSGDDFVAEAFPNSPEGECVEKIIDCLQLLSEISVFTRINAFEENLCQVCNNMLQSCYASKVENLYVSFISQVNEDFNFAKLSMEKSTAISDFQAVALVFALKLFSKSDILLRCCSKRVKDVIVVMLCSALDVVSCLVSSFGLSGDQLLKEFKGYNCIVDVATRIFLSHYRLAESWLNMCTNIALARIESKEVLGSIGACDVCMTVLRMHSLRPIVVQCSLWAICVLIGNHPQNVSRLLSWSSDNWTEDSIKKYLLNIQRNKGQTAEARDHASLIQCSIEMYEKAGQNFRGASEGVDFDVESKLFLQHTDDEASEYIDFCRKPGFTLNAPTVHYDVSKYPTLNTQPFYQFNIVGVSSTKIEKKGVFQM